jgi:hypothetical protein
LCHHSNFAYSLFLNKCFKRGIIRAYHITLAGILFLGSFTVTLNITRVISLDLILRCTTYQACTQILVLAAIEDAVMRTCMYLLDF